MSEIPNPKVQAMLEKFGTTIKDNMPHGWGFVLVFIEFKSRETIYLSSIDRQNAAAFLYELPDKMRRDSYSNPSPN